MKKVRFALVGCGSISRKHIAALKRISNAELACVSDINRDTAKITGEENSVNYYTDPHQMAKKEEFDVFTILTPSGNHADIMKQLTVYNKDFIVEKPLDVDLDKINETISICNKKGLKLFVVHQNRFNRPVQALKKAIDENRLGRLVLGTVRVRWTRKQEYYDAKGWRRTISQGGGVLANQANHHVDMLLWLMGEVESVMAKAETMLVNIEADDTCIAILKFKNGALGIIEATTATRPSDIEGSVSIMGEAGSAEIGGFFMNELKTWKFTDKIDADDSVFNDFGRNPDEFAWNHTEYLKDVTSSILGKKNGLVDGEQARRTVRLIDAIYKSVKTGKEVFLNEKKSREELQNISECKDR